MSYKSFYSTKVNVMARITRIIGGVLLIIQCASCGSTSNAPARTLASSPSPRATAPFSQTRSLDIPGLLHISEHPTPAICPAYHEVLATDRLTYDSVELQQLRDFYFSIPTPPMPDMLTIAYVNLADSVPSWGPFTAQKCEIALSMTNVGQKAIQVTQIGMKLIAAPQAINHHYRLINACVFTPPGRECFAGGEGVNPYLYYCALGPARANTVFQGQLEGAQPVLKPGDTVEMSLLLSPKDASGYLEYSLIPELLLSTSNTKEQVYDLPQLNITVPFSGADHFSCYNLHGNTFVPIPPSPVSPPWETVACA
jgi:hypothetical protein